MQMTMAQIRKVNDLTQKDVAKATGVSIPTVQRIENFEIEPKIGYIYRFCELFDLDIKDILFFKEDVAKMH